MPPRLRPRLRTLTGALACVAAVALAPSLAQATIVERIVAVVGEQPVLLSELRQRARPFLLRIFAQVPEPQQKNEEGKMYKELLGKLVDERLVALAADKLNTTVTTKEVDDAVKLRAADLGKSINEVVEDANKQGLSELDYREEVRRELLFGKMLETRVRQRVRVTDEDVLEYYKQIQGTERRQQQFRASILVLDLASGAVGEARRTFADALVKAARSGADFAQLARKYSVDGSRVAGGDVGWRNPAGYGKPVDDAILRLDAGDVSEPLVLGATLMIVKVTAREKSQIPALAEVRDLVVARVRDEQLQKQIRIWLDELKQGVYIDTRL